MASCGKKVIGKKIKRESVCNKKKIPVGRNNPLAGSSVSGQRKKKKS